MPLLQTDSLTMLQDGRDVGSKMIALPFRLIKLHGGGQTFLGQLLFSAALSRSGAFAVSIISRASSDAKNVFSFSISRSCARIRSMV